jgi:twitching motility two-component system response regulator PilG
MRQDFDPSPFRIVRGVPFLPRIDAGRPPTNMRALKVMVVDDDPTTLEVASALLEQRGHQVLKRTSSIGTTMAILREKPDVVLLDVNMPGLSGDRVAEVVSPRMGKSVPMLILHSGSSREELEQLARRCGAQGILEKTGDPFEFIRRFERLLSQNKSLRSSPGEPPR